MLVARTAVRRAMRGMRFNSSNTTTNATNAAKNTLEGAQATATKGLESAQAAASKALARAQQLAGPLGDRVVQMSGSTGGRVASLLGGYREPLMYNLAVAREVLKQVYIAEKLAPPRSLAQVVEVYKGVVRSARSPAFWRETLQSGAWAKIGIYALEAYTIFKIGEIIGRRKLVGYKLE
ncbi:mitochondrial ATP synthase g subunit-domain-containing protein [Auriculariales sp. MPI-PUGE-AT-0066]|nr:mitochondrial ATP synthase g subunit-domain-containing protein [Auriculariales sp. MPI-PUGE-AT-0066]